MEIYAKKAKRFLSFLYLHFPDMTGDQMLRKLTDVTGALSKMDIEWSRTRNVSRMVKACRKARPTNHREKRPWSVFHIQLAEKPSPTKHALPACFSAGAPS